MIAHFEASWLPVHEYREVAIAQPGLYAMWLSRRGWDDLGLDGPPRTDGGWVYVGKAERSVRSRALRRHLGFDAKCTGWSSPRRSLVALLRERLDLEVLPRDQLKPGNYAIYGLDTRDEWELGCWLNDNAMMADWPHDGSRALRDVEQGVIATLAPPLNLTHCRTRWTDHVKAKRAECAQLAEQWAVERGLAPATSPWSDPPAP